MKKEVIKRLIQALIGFDTVEEIKSDKKNAVFAITATDKDKFAYTISKNITFKRQKRFVVIKELKVTESKNNLKISGSWSRNVSINGEKKIDYYLDIGDIVNIIHEKDEYNFKVSHLDPSKGEIVFNF